MSVDASKLVIPGHGTVFTAPPNTIPPSNPLDVFTLQGQPSPWTNLGHTSKANTIAFTKEGGEKESIHTFLADAVRTTTAAITWGVTIPALQFDADNLNLAFNGKFNPSTGGYIVATAEPVEAALFLYFADTTGSLGFWIPNTVISLGDAPSIDTTQFLELQLAASIQSAANEIIPAVGDRAGVFEIFKSGLTPLHTGWSVSVDGVPTGGTFTLSINGDATDPLAYNADAEDIETELQSIVGAPAATVTGAGPFTVTFPDAVSLTGDGGSLTGGTDPDVTVTATA